MTTHRFKTVLLAACVAGGALGVAASSNAASIDQILDVGKQRTAEAKT
ncbi:MAG: hypothetical protein HON38_08770, partial [Halieaceae bacterium]|nr:hypothetical protein [Halieaceae bacterium]